jgi:RNA polymerase sigma-70 factor (ECF subfamily)
MKMERPEPQRPALATRADPGQADWVARATEGDASAFAMLVEAYQAPVFHLCLRMLGNREDAEDAAQESFLRAYRGLKRYDPARPFGTWLLSIASHYCIDMLRKRRLTFVSVEEEMPPGQEADPHPGPEEALSLVQRREGLSRMLGTLTPQDRAAIVLRYWFDLSYEEIAAALNLTVPAAKSRLHRARRTLAEQWAERRRGGEPAWRAANEPSTV